MSEKIKQYWDDRAKENVASVTGTTNDVYLRELEISTFIKTIESFSIGNDGALALDIGCGDGYTTLHIAKQFPEMEFMGVDYSGSMIRNANSNLQEEPISNLNFGVADATKIGEKFAEQSFDLVLTDRCLINLDSSDDQYDAIRQIGTLLKPEGHYIGIENFTDGQENLTSARAAMGLSEIPVRWHNLFFDVEEFRRRTAEWFSSVRFNDFSSAYYYATRVLYSAMCKANGEEPDYEHEIHRLAVGLPPIGKNFSPIRMFVLKK